MRKTRQIAVGNVLIGGGAPVVIQSMTNRPAADAEGTLAQIEALYRAGCQLIRVAVPNQSSLPAIAEICRRSPLPVIGDIHFDYRLALGAMASGCKGIRVNPGNLGLEPMREVAREAKNRGCAVRIGVNGGSLSAEARAKYGTGAEALVNSALQFAEIFEAEGCTNLKVSLKSSSVRTSVDACRLFASQSELPLHLGVTEAGPVSTGIIKSAIGIGSLLLDGIGETIRVSLTADPVEEIRAARRILSACGLYDDFPEIVSCPTCGRTRIALLPLVEAAEKAIEQLKQEGYRINLRKVAIMGCEVNGPGEAKDADVGIAGGNGWGILFKHGEKVCTVPENELLNTLMDEVKKHSVKL